MPSLKGSFLKQYLSSWAERMAIALPPAQPAGCKPSPYCCPCNARSRLEKHAHDKGVFKGNFILKSVRLTESTCSCHVWVIASKRALFASANGAGVWPVDGWNCQLGWHAESQPEVRSLLALVSKASPHPVSEQGCMTTTTKPVISTGRYIQHRWPPVQP